MNRIKTYRIFENSTDKDLVDDVNDILLELNDEGFTCRALLPPYNAAEELPPGILRNVPDGYKLVKTHDFIYVVFEKSSGYSLDDIREVYGRIKKHLNNNEYFENTREFIGTGNTMGVHKFKRPIN